MCGILCSSGFNGSAAASLVPTAAAAADCCHRQQSRRAESFSSRELPVSAPAAYMYKRARGLFGRAADSQSACYTLEPDLHPTIDQ